MKEITRIESKQIMIDLLDAFAKFCESHQLRYYLTYGTLLGAIRHHGFIPWDDDVDVMMPRPDYEKFINLTKNGLAPKMRVAAFAMTPGYIYPFAKVIREDTVLIEEKTNFKTGIYIDIFPVDGLPQSQEARNKHYHKMAILRRVHSLAFRLEHRWVNPFLKIILKILIQLTHLYGDQRVLKHIDNLAKSLDFDQSETVGIIVWGYGGSEACLKTEMLPQIELPFETLILKAPANTQAWLKQVYGDYMTPPPENERASPHINTIYWVDQTK